MNIRNAWLLLTRVVGVWELWIIQFVRKTFDLCFIILIKHTEASSKNSQLETVKEQSFPSSSLVWRERREECQGLLVSPKLFELKFGRWYFASRIYWGISLYYHDTKKKKKKFHVRNLFFFEWKFIKPFT